MRKIKKIGVLFLCVLLLIPLFSVPVGSTNSIPSTVAAPSVSAQSAILIEGGGCSPIYQKNADEIRPMASTTKIMTALVAIERAPLDTVIAAPACAISTEGSSIYLIEGEQLTLEQLLYALMLESANDAAVAIAVGLAGSVEEFANWMNEKATALGLVNTHFTNPHGLDHEAHYTTARELAIITAHALKNESFRSIAATRKITIPHAGTSGVRLLVNHNKMLRLYEDCIGVKTGYTKKSGRCLVSAAERDGVTVIAVTLSAPDDWNDHQKMLDYGFHRYQSVTLCEAGDFQFPLSVVGGTDAYVTLRNLEGFQAVLPIDHGEISYTVEARRFEYAPICAGDVLGRVNFYQTANGTREYLGSVNLTAEFSISQKPHKKGLFKRFLELLGF